MNESLIDVLIYIYEHYMDQDEATASDQLMLEDELLKAGFQQDEIRKAFDWLDELAWRQGSMAERREQPASQSMRIYTSQEQQRLDHDARGLLLYLEQIGVLDDVSRELVIERALAIESADLDTDDLKWIVLLVLLNQPGQEGAHALMEELVYFGEGALLH